MIRLAFLTHSSLLETRETTTRRCSASLWLLCFIWESRHSLHMLQFLRAVAGFGLREALAFGSLLERDIFVEMTTPPYETRIALTD